MIIFLYFPNHHLHLLHLRTRIPYSWSSSRWCWSHPCTCPASDIAPIPPYFTSWTPWALESRYCSSSWWMSSDIRPWSGRSPPPSPTFSASCPFSHPQVLDHDRALCHAHFSHATSPANGAIPHGQVRRISGWPGPCPCWHHTPQMRMPHTSPLDIGGTPPL